MINKRLECQLFFKWIDDYELKTELTKRVIESKTSRNETQKEVSNWTGISLTKVKEIEKGTCKDFNSINNYLNYFGNPILID